MKAAVVRSFDEPLQIADVAVPEPGHGQVLVRVETSGLCHTDIHAAHGDWPGEAKPAVHTRTRRGRPRKEARSRGQGPEGGRPGGGVVAGLGLRSL